MDRYFEQAIEYLVDMEIAGKAGNRLPAFANFDACKYDAAVTALSDLLDKRDALRRDELVKAIMKSDRTYEEVLAFLGTRDAEDEA
jgi:hypothetical protein